MPHQRRHVVEDDRHPDVVDRRVGEQPDRVVGDRVAAEDPDVAGPGDLARGVEGQARLGVRRQRSWDDHRVSLWKWLGLAGVAGVAATGVVIARDQRQRAALTPDEVRERLHARLDESSTDDESASD